GGCSYDTGWWEACRRSTAPGANGAGIHSHPARVLLQVRAAQEPRTSIQHIIQYRVDHPRGDGHQHQVAACAVPLIAGVMRQVAYMARRDLVAPAMGQGAA